MGIGQKAPFFKTDSWIYVNLRTGIFVHKK